MCLKIAFRQLSNTLRTAIPSQGAESGMTGFLPPVYENRPWNRRLSFVMECDICHTLISQILSYHSKEKIQAASLGVSLAFLRKIH